MTSPPRPPDEPPPAWQPLPAWQPQPSAPPLPPLPRVNYWVQPERKQRRISRFRSGRRRVRIAAVLLAIAISAAIAQAVHYFDGLRFVERARGGYVTIGQGIEFDDVSRRLAFIGIGLSVLTGIAFLAWLSRAVDNLGPLGLMDPDPPASPRAAIAWWFVPFANYVMPYLIVADLQRRLLRQTLERTLVLGWWIAWLGGTAVTLVEVSVAAETLDLDTVARLWSIEAFGEFLRAISGVLAIVVILAIEAGTDRRWAALTAPQPLPPSGPPPGPLVESSG